MQTARRIVSGSTDDPEEAGIDERRRHRTEPVSYTHLRAHGTVLDLVCRLLLEKKKKRIMTVTVYKHTKLTTEIPDKELATENIGIKYNDTQIQH